MKVTIYKEIDVNTKELKEQIFKGLDLFFARAGKNITGNPMKDISSDLARQYGIPESFSVGISKQEKKQISGAIKNILEGYIEKGPFSKDKKVRKFLKDYIKENY